MNIPGFDSLQSSIRRKSGTANALEQTIHFQSGVVEVNFNRTENEVKLVSLSKTSRPDGDRGQAYYNGNNSCLPFFTAIPAQSLRNKSLAAVQEKRLFRHPKE